MLADALHAESEIGANDPSHTADPVADPSAGVKKIAESAACACIEIVAVASGAVSPMTANAPSAAALPAVAALPVGALRLIDSRLPDVVAEPVALPVGAERLDAAMLPDAVAAPVALPVAAVRLADGSAPSAVTEAPDEEA